MSVRRDQGRLGVTRQHLKRQAHTPGFTQHLCDEVLERESALEGHITQTMTRWRDIHNRVWLQCIDEPTGRSMFHHCEREVVGKEEVEQGIVGGCAGVRLGAADLLTSIDLDLFTVQRVVAVLAFLHRHEAA